MKLLGWIIVASGLIVGIAACTVTTDDTTSDGGTSTGGTAGAGGSTAGAGATPSAGWATARQWAGVRSLGEAGGLVDRSGRLTLAAGSGSFRTPPPSDLRQNVPTLQDVTGTRGDLTAVSLDVVRRALVSIRALPRDLEPVRQRLDGRDRRALLEVFDLVVTETSDARDGQHQTPANVARLVAALAQPQPGERVGDVGDIDEAVMGRDARRRGVRHAPREVRLAQVRERHDRRPDRADLGGGEGDDLHRLPGGGHGRHRASRAIMSASRQFWHNCNVQRRAKGLNSDICDRGKDS